MEDGNEGLTPILDLSVGFGEVFLFLKMGLILLLEIFCFSEYWLVINSSTFLHVMNIKFNFFIKRILNSTFLWSVQVYSFIIITIWLTQIVDDHGILGFPNLMQDALILVDCPVVNETLRCLNCMKFWPLFLNRISICVFHHLTCSTRLTRNWTGFETGVKIYITTIYSLSPTPFDHLKVGMVFLENCGACCQDRIKYNLTEWSDEKRNVSNELGQQKKESV